MSSSTTTRRMYIEASYPSKSCKTVWYGFLHRIYMQFLLITTLYVMEPWERALVMGIFFLIVSLISYSALVFIPYHLQHIFTSLSNTSMPC